VETKKSCISERSKFRVEHNRGSAVKNETILRSSSFWLIILRENCLLNKGDQSILSSEFARQSLSMQIDGGKSGLHRVECQVTPGGCEPTASAAESIPPKQLRLPVRVKWCGKSAPHDW